MDKKSPKRRILDKVLMGAVIGGAIGSIVGATIAPKKGKETRKEIVGIAKRAKEETMTIFNKLKRLISRRKKKIPNEHV
jgi:gas vesicle protein